MKLRKDPTLPEFPSKLIVLSTSLGRIVRIFSKNSANNIQPIDKSALIQFYRSGTSVGANIREARFAASLIAASLKDHINKLKIAEKELAEFFYWLDVLSWEQPVFTEEQLNILHDTAKQCYFILAATIKTCKTKLSSE